MSEEPQSPQEKNLLENENINLTENPVIFHYNKPSFTRNLFKKKSEKQGLSPAKNDARKETHKCEKKPFLDAAGVVSGSSDDEPKLALIAPEDRFNLCYIIMYILGFGTLLPWNFFITANGYFSKKLESKPAFQVRFQNFFAVAAMVPNVLMMLLNIFFLQRFNRIFRMGIALLGMLVLFVLTTALVLIDTEDWTREFFAITLASMVFINMCSAVLQGGLFGFAGMLPPRYTQAVMGGQALSGVFAALASILSRLGENDIYKSSFGYFFTASIVLGICLIALVLVFRLDYVKHYTSNNLCTCKTDSLVHDHLDNFVNEDALEKLEIITKPKSPSNKTPYFYMFKSLFPMASSVVIIFMVTLACFPALTARIESVSKESDWSEKYFVSVTCFLLFNGGDYLGRTLAGFVQIPRKTSPKWILPAISVSRLVFIPLFIFCNAQPRTLPVIFNHDAFPIVFMLLFATSCGYFGSLGMMYGPGAVEGQHAEFAGNIMACCLSLGLGSGSASSFLVTSFI